MRSPCAFSPRPLLAVTVSPCGPRRRYTGLLFRFPRVSLSIAATSQWSDRSRFQASAAGWLSPCSVNGSAVIEFAAWRPPRKGEDRKSTRLNSSHSQISYAVFCLKKKKKTKEIVQLSLYDRPNE